MNLFQKNVSKKVCLICHEPHNEFNKEHIFPETIGGTLVTYQICKNCNSFLGKTIDTPFLAHPLIGTNRVKYNLSKQKNRKIPNPLKKEEYKIGNDVYSLYLNNDLSVEKTLNLKIDYPENKDFTKGIRVKMDCKDIDRLPEIKRRIAKNIGVPYEEIVEGEKIFEKTLGGIHIIKTPNNPLILEALKILYESACLYVPDFDNDLFSLIYLDILKSGKVPEHMKIFINPGDQFYSAVFQIFTSKFYTVSQNSHIVFFVGMNNIGLIGIVKIFDKVMSIVLSPEKKFFNQQYLLINNDFLNRKVSFHKINRIKDVSIELPENFMTNHYKIFNKTEFLQDCICENGTPSIFNNVSKILFNNIFEIPVQIPTYIVNGNFIDSLNFSFNCSELSLFFKIKNSSLLIPIDNLTFNAEISCRSKL